MEITAEQQRTIDGIKRELKCPKDFKCHSRGLSNFPKLRRAGKLLVCLEQNAAECAYSIPFGFGDYCCCPLMNYLYNIGHEGPTEKP
jgi:hypothetical protein